MLQFSSSRFAAVQAAKEGLKERHYCYFFIMDALAFHGHEKDRPYRSLSFLQKWQNALIKWQEKPRKGML